MRRHGTMTTILSGLLAASLLVGLPVGSAFADEPTDGTGAGQSATEVLDTLEVKGRDTSARSSARLGRMWIITAATPATTSSIAT